MNFDRNSLTTNQMDKLLLKLKEYTYSLYFSYYSSSSPINKQFLGQKANSENFCECIRQDLYKPNNFRMYIYKVQKCSELYSHNWTCFSSRGKIASCMKGDHCELCHRVFEYSLHPTKYRTILCQAGMSCNRPICFFAHTLKELRPETKYNWYYVYQYLLYIQSFPGIMIENGSNCNWMIILCNL
uniref:AtC3H23-like CCCH zinc finger domain-containing protein n=1 Tax=Solanum lycopersicum TaxID=4081 RepID=A0A3Q7GJH4_SOLLC